MEKKMENEVETGVQGKRKSYARIVYCNVL